jgi:hypothetical protein
MFDYDRNEHLDIYKQTMQFEVLEEEMRSMIGNVDDTDSFEEDEFGYVDEDERREALAEAGMDPDKYDKCSGKLNL